VTKASNGANERAVVFA